MHFQILLLDEVQTIVSASCKQMGNFLSIFAAIDMKNQLLTGKDVVFVEGAAGLLLVLALFEHFRL
jgi:hypothetical protein